MSKRYFVGRAPDLTKLITYQPINSILDWYIFSLDSEDINGINSLSDRYVEMDKEMAIFGMRSIGDIRSVIKVPADELKTEADFDNLSYADMAPTGAKAAVPVTQKRYDTILRTMKFLAKLIIEQTYEQRFLALDEGVTALEKKTWEYQNDDVDNDNDYIIRELSTAKGVSPTDLKTKIKEKRSAYDRNVKALYIKSAELKREFSDCTSIRQINRLYEKYLGLAMPESQAKEENKYTADEFGTYIREEVVPGIKF